MELYGDIGLHVDFESENLLLIIPELDVSVPEKQRQVVPGHVRQLARDHEDAVVCVRPEFHGQLEVAVRVRQRGQGQVRVAAEPRP